MKTEIFAELENVLAKTMGRADEKINGVRKIAGFILGDLEDIDLTVCEALPSGDLRLELFDRIERVRKMVRTIAETTELEIK